VIAEDHLSHKYTDTIYWGQ